MAELVAALEPASVFVGVDVGTSGVRAMAMDVAGVCVGMAKVDLPPPHVDGARASQDPQLWWQAVQAVLDALATQIDMQRVRGMAVDGTSGTLLLTDGVGHPLSEGWMYFDTRCTEQVARIAQMAPPQTAAHGASSPLARLMHLQDLYPLAAHALHQADWLAFMLGAELGVSDDNNALKLGYDVVQRQWPSWLDALNVRRTLLPKVLAPGTRAGVVRAELAQRWGLRADVVLAAGTTDGVAAFLATGASAVGDAVTSLGTTLVIKLLSDKPVFAPEYGIYSHRLGALWLAGGASNSGGAALLQHFSALQITQLSNQLRPGLDTGFNYYPLAGVGERFPIQDASMASRTTPRPADDAVFFQGLLEGVAGVERLAFERLAELGAPPVRRVLSVGGGATNDGFTQIRARVLGVPVLQAAQSEAAVGAARLARQAVEALA